VALDAHVLDIRPVSTMLASHVDGIEDAKASKAWADHHARWAGQMPRDAANLWTFIVELDHDSRMALFGHCVALTVNVVRLPSERPVRWQRRIDWRRPCRSIRPRIGHRPRGPISVVSPSRILTPCGKPSVSDKAAERMADMKK
jgi:ParB family transcriptional regulator, chromosome partitioning protein